MKPNLTFQQSEIQDGDIICFQKALTTTNEYENEELINYMIILLCYFNFSSLISFRVQERKAANKIVCLTIPEFYRYLLSLNQHKKESKNFKLVEIKE